MKTLNFEANKHYIRIITHNTMKKTNWYINIGVGFIALAILLKVLKLQYNASIFAQGFSIGLGLVLIVRGFIVKRVKKKSNSEKNTIR